MNIDILLLVKCADIPNKLIGLIVAKLKRIGRIVFQLGWNIHIQAVTRTTLCDNNFYKTKNPHGSQQQQQQKSYRNTDWSEFNAKISGNTASTGFRIAHTQNHWKTGSGFIFNNFFFGSHFVVIARDWNRDTTITPCLPIPIRYQQQQQFTNKTPNTKKIPLSISESKKTFTNTERFSFHWMWISLSFCGS